MILIKFVGIVAGFAGCVGVFSVMFEVAIGAIGGVLCPAVERLFPERVPSPCKATGDIVL